MTTTDMMAGLAPHEAGRPRTSEDACRIAIFNVGLQAEVEWQGPLFRLIRRASGNPRRRSGNCRGGGARWAGQGRDGCCGERRACERTLDAPKRSRTIVRRSDALATRLIFGVRDCQTIDELSCSQDLDSLDFSQRKEMAIS